MEPCFGPFFWGKKSRCQDHSLRGLYGASHFAETAASLFAALYRRFDFQGDNVRHPRGWTGGFPTGGDEKDGGDGRGKLVMGLLCHDCPRSLKFQSCQSKQSNRTAGINSSTCCRCGARIVPYWQILTWRPLKSREYGYTATYQMTFTAAVY